jgi:hypothetical protein
MMDNKKLVFVFPGNDSVENIEKLRELNHYAYSEYDLLYYCNVDAILMPEYSEINEAYKFIDVLNSGIPIFDSIEKLQEYFQEDK